MSDTVILKWSVPVDDAEHNIGAGHVALVASQDAAYLDAAGHRRAAEVQVWTVETAADFVETPRKVRVYGTGHAIPEGCKHLGSTLAGAFVWHVVEVAR